MILMHPNDLTDAKACSEKTKEYAAKYPNGAKLTRRLLEKLPTEDLGWLGLQLIPKSWREGRRFADDFCDAKACYICTKHGGSRAKAVARRNTIEAVLLVI